MRHLPYNTKCKRDGHCTLDSFTLPYPFLSWTTFLI
jgi:hypothetical protein